MIDFIWFASVRVKPKLQIRLYGRNGFYMKQNKIMLFFWIALPAGVILTFLQQFLMIESDTGFFKTENAAWGYLISTVVFLMAILCGVFAYLTFTKPDSVPKGNLTLTLAALLPAVSLIYERFTETFPSNVFIWQQILLKGSGILAALFFAAFAVQELFGFKIPPVCYTLPLIYFLISLICNFTSISTLALVADNVSLVACYCALLLFWLSFAKLYNDLDEEKNFKKILSFGLTAVVLCLSKTIPFLALILSGKGNFAHSGTGANLTLLTMGIFILTFVLQYHKKSAGKH